MSMLTQIGIAVADNLFKAMARRQIGVKDFRWWLIPAKVKFKISSAINVPIE